MSIDTDGVALLDPHAANLLGRETEPPIRRPRPKFRHYPGPVVCAIVGLLFSALAAFGYLTFRADRSPGFYAFIALCAAFMILGAIVTTWNWLGFGVTISPRELGVVVIAGRRQSSLRYADIDAITIADRARYDERRVVAALTRTITIESNGARRRTVYVALPQDPLDPILERLVQRIAIEPRSRAGAGWTIDEASLHWRGLAIPLPTIASAGVFDGEVRLWRRGEESPFLAVPLSSKNARVLLSIGTRAASRSAPSKTVTESVADDGTALGRLLFVRRTSVWSVIWNSALIAGALWLGMLSFDRFAPEYARLGRGALLGMAVLAALHALGRLAMRYRFHERGVTCATLLGNRTVLYARVATMTWRETTTLVNHISVGTTIRVTLAPDDSSKSLKIRLHRFRAVDPDLEPLRRGMALSIAERLRAHLAHGDDIPWTSDATFTQAGVELKTGLFGQGTELLPYGQPVGIHMSEGFLVLFRETWRKPLATLNASVDNFYPGLALFESLTQSPSTAAQKATSR